MARLYLLPRAAPCCLAGLGAALLGGLGTETEPPGGVGGVVGHAPVNKGALMSCVVRRVCGAWKMVKKRQHAVR